MKKVFTAQEIDFYNEIMRSLKFAAWAKYGQLKNFAAVLNVEETYLNKVLNCSVACNSRLFVTMVILLDFGIFKGIRCKDGLIYPLVNPFAYALDETVDL